MNRKQMIKDGVIGTITGTLIWAVILGLVKISDHFDNKPLFSPTTEWSGFSFARQNDPNNARAPFVEMREIGWRADGVVVWRPKN